MDNKAAEERFIRADGLYRQGEYAASLAVLDELDQAFPNQRRVLFPRARCLAKLGRRDEALALCERLIIDHGYDKARALRDRLLGAEMAEIMTTPGLFDTPAGGAPPGPEEGRRPIDQGGDVEYSLASVDESKQLFGIRPVRLALLLLIVAAVYFGWIPLWLGAGAVGAYFAIKWLLRRALYRLFTAPFKMKAAALHGATVDVHSVTAAEAPQPGADDEDGEAVDPAAPMRWLSIDVTITPAPPKGPFTHWEPGELAVVDAGARITSLDDLDGACQVHDVSVVGGDGTAQPWEGEKYAGPLRLRLRVGLNPAWREGKFVYYTESFGRIDLTTP